MRTGIAKAIKIIAFCLFATATPLLAQLDQVGSGHCIHFDGIDDYVDLGDVYNDITFPFTLSAWVNVSSSNTLALPIFASQDDDGLYNGFWLYVTPSVLLAECGDGRGGINVNFRRGFMAPLNQNIFGKWNHLTFVLESESSMRMYLNGVQLGTIPSTGESPLPMNSNSPGHASIGKHKTSSLFQMFQGDMDEIRIFNYALSETQIRDQMCRKLTGSESGLIGYWRFDETSGTTTDDLSSRNYDGQLKNGATQIFSGAPVGDESTYVYSANWATTTPSIGSGSGLVTITNIQNNPQGVHLYKVNSVPSQTAGLTAPNPLYYGAFMASTDYSAAKNFHVNYANSCGLFHRHDNSVPSWIEVSNSNANFVNSEEFIKAFDNNIPLDVGIAGLESGPLVCDQESITLSMQTTATGVSTLWSTGATSPSITVSESGTYAVTISNGCNSAMHEVTVEFLNSPSDFSLGDDVVSCSMTPLDLNPIINPTGLSFTWQDGSSQPTYHVSDFGTYWLMVENQCGFSRDTLTIARPPDYPLSVGISGVGSGPLVCDQKSITLSMQTAIADVSILWNTGQTSPSISVSESGTYTLTISKGCNVASHDVSVQFQESPPDFSLGDDVVECTMTPFDLNPVTNVAGLTFAWQDGSATPTFHVSDFGTYWLTLENECGLKTDTLTIARSALAEDYALPNFITPNGDDYNGTFQVHPLLVGSELQISNRWGQSVYRTSNYQNEWSGEDLASGVYFYRLYNQCFGEFKGWISVMR